MTLTQQIDHALRDNPHGWCSVEKAHHLAACVLCMGGGTVVEVGIFAGRSFFPMALVIKHLGNGKIIGIDPWDGEVAAEGEGGAHADWWKNIDHDHVENSFREGLMELELEEISIIHKAKSGDVESPAEISVLHIDGSHMEQAVADVNRFAPHVVIGGFCILDDLTWSGGKVEESAKLLLEYGFVERRRVLGQEDGTNYKNDYAVFQRTHHC